MTLQYNITQARTIVIIIIIYKETDKKMLYGEQEVLNTVIWFVIRQK